MLRNKQIVQIILVGLIICLITLLIGCRPEDSISGGQDHIEGGQLPTLTDQSEVVTATIVPTLLPQPSSTPTLPGATSESLPAAVEVTLTMTATPEITPIPGLNIERTFNIGGARIYDDWGERIAISPDERWLAVISANQEIGSDGVNGVRWEEVRLYDFETGQQLHMLQRTNSAAETYGAMAFSPDSQRLAVAGTEQIIWVWDVTSGELVQQFSFWGPISDLAFSPDGTRVTAVSPSEDTREYGIGIFDIKTGSLVAQMREMAMASVTFLGNEEQLVIGAGTYPHPNQARGDAALFMWNFGSDTVTNVLSQHGMSRVIALNREAQILAAVIENKLHLIELQSLFEIDVEKPEIRARSLSFDNAGNLWALDFDGLLTEWRVDGKLLTQMHFDGATDFTVIPSTDHLLISFPDHLWEVSFDE